MKGNEEMYKIVKKKVLNPTVTLMEIDAPLIAKKAEPGQFIILRVDNDGERIPLTIAGYDREAGTVRIIFQIVGATTEKLNQASQTSPQGNGNKKEIRGQKRQSHTAENDAGDTGTVSEGRI